MPGVPHPRHDGLATVFHQLKTDMANIGQQQNYPDVYTDTETYTITYGGLLDTTAAALPSPGPVTHITNASASLSFSVSLTCVITLGLAGYDAGSVTGIIGFLINGYSADNGYVPLQATANPVTITVGGTPYTFMQPFSSTISATWLVSQSSAVTLGDTSTPRGILWSHIVPGANTFEVVAATSVASEMQITGISLVTIPC